MVYTRASPSLFIDAKEFCYFTDKNCQVTTQQRYQWKYYKNVLITIRAIKLLKACFGDKSTFIWIFSDVVSMEKTSQTIQNRFPIHVSSIVNLL